MLRNTIRKTRSVRSLHEGREAGFTLIELLIVIVILGVLAGIVVFSVSGITDTGTKAACQSDYKTVVVASEAYRAQDPAKKYPADVAALASAKFLQSDPGTVTITGGGTSTPPTYAFAAGKCAGVTAP